MLLTVCHLTLMHILRLLLTASLPFLRCGFLLNMQGFVYLRFAATQSAEAAYRALHGRWYGGRQILAEYQFLQVYNSHFKLHAK
jgi:hypothetical protein